MTKLQRSWALLKCSLRVVRENPKLLLFPLIVLSATCVIALFFIVPLAFWNTGHAFTEAAHWKALASHVVTWGKTDSGMHVEAAGGLTVPGYAAVGAIYMLSVFLATFFNVAFFNEILHALNGQAVSVRGGLRFALSRLRAIILWSLFTGVVGLLIKALEERVGWLGRWIVRLIGIAWSVASVFVVPVIIREEKHANPLLFLRTSAGILRKTWGESLIGYIGVQVANWLLLLGSILLLALAVFLSMALENIWILVVASGAWFLGIVLFTLLLNVASQVFRCALYIYATEGVVPGPFEKDQMDLAWKVKSGRKAR